MPDSTPAATPASTPASTPAPHDGGGQTQGWCFTLEGKGYEVTPEAAQKAINEVAQTLASKVAYYKGYQEEFGKATNSFMNGIIELASGHSPFQPDAAIWDTISGEIEAAKGSAASDPPGAAANLNKAEQALGTASEAWQTYLNHFYGGGDNVITGLGYVVKLSITIEAVALTPTGAGAGAVAAIGAGNAGLSEMVDQWVSINQGKTHEFEWGKMGISAITGAILGAAGNAVQPAVAEAMAKYMPSIVGANTAFLESLGTKFIDNDTGVAVTAAKIAADMEPLWGKLISKVPVGIVKGAIDAASGALTGSVSLEDGIKKICEGISLDSLTDVFFDVLKEVLKPA
jgi:hypothetical protein